MANTPAERQAEMAAQRRANDNAAITRAQEITQRGGPVGPEEEQALEAGQSAADHRRSARAMRKQ